MSDVYIGIDPGLTGGVAILNGTFADVVDCPVMERMNAKERAAYDIKSMFALLRFYLDQNEGSSVHVVLEEAAPMPKGSIANFSKGYGYGIWIMAVVANNIPYTTVRPNKWKKVFGLSQTKDLSREKAIQQFPHLHEKLKLKKHHGRAEALLLAVYGRSLNGSVD